MARVSDLHEAIWQLSPVDRVRLAREILHDVVMPPLAVAPDRIGDFSTIAVKVAWAALEVGNDKSYLGGVYG